MAGPNPVWVPPSNVRIVQRDGADNVRSFTTLNQALATITDASASNPYLVKVMPGTYDAYSGSVKPYVSFEGSGTSSTTVYGAGVQNGIVSDMTIIGGVSLLGGGEAHRVTVVAPDAVAVAISAPTGDAVIADSTIYGRIEEDLGGFRMVHSKVVANSAFAISNYAITLYGAGNQMAPLPVDIIDSEVTASGGSQPSGDAVLWVDGNNTVTIRGSVVSAPTVVVTGPAPNINYSVAVAGSQVNGSLATLRTGIDRVVNCYDAAFSPIPNF